ECYFVVCSADRSASLEICTLSLHDALPISAAAYVSTLGAIIIGVLCSIVSFIFVEKIKPKLKNDDPLDAFGCHGISGILGSILTESEEHTSELQSRFDLVCRLLLEKKHKNI